MMEFFTIDRGWDTLQIIFADFILSGDNVLAVAAIAREETWSLILGLALETVFMTLCATIIIRVRAFYSPLSYLGLIFPVCLSAHMLWDGWPGFASLIGIGGYA